MRLPGSYRPSADNHKLGIKIKREKDRPKGVFLPQRSFIQQGWPVRLPAATTALITFELELDAWGKFHSFILNRAGVGTFIASTQGRREDVLQFFRQSRRI